ncbi:hypothetical protein HB82_23190, partial [Salmonella enterica subsp. enterica]|nr:hypothetical protein [Salmonella enterica subsp. enterica]EDP8781690.1 hypothetical protein [Salmonella enterica subsp. enterica]
DSDFPMSSITGRANFLLTTSTGAGIQMGVKKGHYALFINHQLRCSLLRLQLAACRQTRCGSVLDA